jgi:hypothetical protein
LRLQYELQSEAYGFSTDELSGDDLIQYLFFNAYAITDEIHEAMQEVSWKPWVTTPFFNRPQFLKELIDAAHFLNNLWLAATGMDPEGAAALFAVMYEEKHDLNAKRQVDGYDGVTSKCSHCKRALDDMDIKQAIDVDGTKLWYCECGFIFEREDINGRRS